MVINAATRRNSGFPARRGHILCNSKPLTDVTATIVMVNAMRRAAIRKFDGELAYVGRYCHLMSTSSNNQPSSPRHLEGFQQVMLRWEQIRPYNAVHVVAVRGLQLTSEKLELAASDVLTSIGIIGVGFDRAGKTLTLLPEYSATPVSRLHDVVTDSAGLSRFMSAQLSEPFAERECCPIRLTLINASENVQYVAATYRHAVGDAHSCQLILKAILDHCRTGTWSGNLRIVGVPKLRELFKSDTNWRMGVPRTAKLVSDLLSGLRCMRPKSAAPHNNREICTIHETSLETSRLKYAARKYGVSVQDFLMAAQAEAIAQTLRDSSTFTVNPNHLLGITSMMDLRRHASGSLDNAIGQFLGIVSVRPSVDSSKNFSGLVEFVRKKNDNAKRNREFFWSINSMSLMARIWDCLPLAINRDLARKLYPFVCALSNVNLGSPIAKYVSDGAVTNYFRGANLGVMVPLVLSNTTVGGRFNLCTTHKDSVYTQDEVRQFVDCITNRIHNP